MRSKLNNLGPATPRDCSALSAPTEATCHSDRGVPAISARPRCQGKPQVNFHPGSQFGAVHSKQLPQVLLRTRLATVSFIACRWSWSCLGLCDRKRWLDVRHRRQRYLCSRPPGVRCADTGRMLAGLAGRDRKSRHTQEHLIALGVHTGTLVFCIGARTDYWNAEEPRPRYGYV